MENEIEKQHIDMQRAIDLALWMEFKYRMDDRKFQVVRDSRNNLYSVMPEIERMKNAIELPKDYCDMDYNQIEVIRNDKNPLIHWKELYEIISKIHGQTLRFILYYQIPLDKWIRYELSLRGSDENQCWIGYEKAKEIWLK